MSPGQPPGGRACHIEQHGIASWHESKAHDPDLPLKPIGTFLSGEEGGGEEVCLRQGRQPRLEGLPEEEPCGMSKTKEEKQEAATVVTPRGTQGLRAGGHHRQRGRCLFLAAD